MHEDGALGSGGASGVIFTLDTEIRLPRRGVHHRRLRAGREHRPGHGRSRRVLRPQADLPAGPPRACCGARSAASRSRWSTRRAAPRADAQRADARGRPRALLHHRRGGAGAGRLRDPRSRTTTRTPAAEPMDIEWAKDGLRRQALHRPGAARDGGIARGTPDAVETYALEGEGRRSWSAAARSARRSPPARCGWSPTPPTSPPSAPARCWSPTRPRPTGSR